MPDASDREKIDLALWALSGNTCWLGSTIRRGVAEFCAIAQVGPYAAPEMIEGSESSDPWKSLRLAKFKLEAQLPAPTVDERHG